MKKNFKRPFLDCFGNPVTGNKQPVNIDGQLCTSLFNLSRLDNAPLTPDEKYMAYSLCRKLADTPEAVEMKTEEAAFLKRVAGELMTAGAYGQIVDIIENDQY